ncbi:MAG: helix-turn-helix transcriptional regulator [Lachnospiraceae bacterium]|nr:helix-turn-helix transcriptional regulator [Lachnospiraceae bacterium]
MTDQVLKTISVFTAQLKRRRLQLKLTQAEVARRAGIRQANYSRMESGRQTPNLETLLTVLHVLGLKMTFADASQTVYHVMHLDDVVADVTLSADKKNIRIEKYEPDGIRQPFSGTNLTLERFYRFLKSRCYEDGRADLDRILKKACLSDNNPYQWVALTHGVTYDDFFWIKTDQETLTWDEVRIR